jgi:hypothetical protein
LAGLLAAKARDRGLTVEGSKAATVSDLRRKLRNNNGEAILPAATVRRQIHEAGHPPSAVPEDTA